MVPEYDFKIDRILKQYAERGWRGRKQNKSNDTHEWEMHLVLYREIKNSNIIMHFMFNDYLSRNGSFNDSQVLIYMMHFMFNDYLSRNDSFNDSQLLILQEKQK